MLRQTLGAFEAIVGSSGGQIARGTTVRQLPTQRLWQQRARLSQLRQLRAPVKQTINKPSPLRQVKTPFRSAPRRPFHSSRARKSDGPAKEETKSDEALSLGQRLKKLSREYGWTAVGIYFALSVLDFPFCFLLVRTVGTERVGKLFPGPPSLFLFRCSKY